MITRLLCLLLTISHPLLADSWDSTAKEAAKDSQIRAYRMVKISRACGRGFAAVAKVPFGTTFRAIASSVAAVSLTWFARPYFMATTTDTDLDELLATTMDELETDEEKKKFAERLARAEINLVGYDLTARRGIFTRLFYYPRRFFAWEGTMEPPWSPLEISRGKHWYQSLKDEPSFKQWYETGDGRDSILTDDKDWNDSSARYVIPPRYGLLIPMRAEQIYQRLKDYKTAVDPRIDPLGRALWGTPLRARSGVDDNQKAIVRGEIQQKHLLSRKVSELQGIPDSDIAFMLAFYENRMVSDAPWTFEDGPEMKATISALEGRVGPSTSSDSPKVTLVEARRKYLVSEFGRLRKQGHDFRLQELATAVPFITAEQLNRARAANK